MISMEDANNYFDNQLLSFISEHKHTEAQSLLEATGDPKSLVDNSGATLLHYAAQYGNATMAQYLIDIGCEIDALDEQGRSPLTLAVNYNRIDTVEVLLKANADVNVRDNIGRTILESVLQQGAVTHKADIIALFLFKVMRMCSYDDNLIANKFIENGVNLFKAVSLNRPGVTKVMLEKKCSIEERDANYYTALHLAVEMMNFENIKLLVLYGADINAKGYYGRTPLMAYNMKYEDTKVKLEILTFLLDQGASLTAQDFFDTTPLTFLLSGGDKEIIQIVMQYDVDLLGFNKFGQNALHYLVDNKNPGVFDIIRGKNFDVNARNSQRFTPLLLAVKNYDIEKVEFLLKHGADVNAQSTDGHSALLLLFMNRLEDERNISDILKLLLDYGIDIEATFPSGISVFDLAVKNNYFFRIKPVISKLVIDEIRGKSIGQLTREKINSNRFFKHHYKTCKLQIRQLRYKIVHGSISLFKLLFESDEKRILYARNREFYPKFKLLLAKVNVDSYIFDTLWRCVDEAVRIADLKETAASGINKFTDLPISTVVYRIVDYLDFEDLEKLHKL